MVDSFVKMKRFGHRFYFGFSSFVNRRSPKTPDVIAAVPRDRLLLESDLENPEEIDAALEDGLDMLAEATGLPKPDVAALTLSNAMRFYRGYGIHVSGFSS